jgi:hypothetical protein
LHDPALSEVLSRKRVGYFASHDFDTLYKSLADGHEARSKWFKPQAALALGQKALSAISREQFAAASKAAYDQGIVRRLNIDAASDGLRAYWRLRPDSE